MADFPFAAAGNLLGDIMGIIHGGNMAAANNQQQWNMFNQNAQLQREFAQNAVQWRVADAKAAGIHPIYALGGAGATYTPSAMNLGGGDDGSHFSRIGQNLGRAIEQMKGKEARELTLFEQTRNAQELERGQLQNDMLKLQLAGMAARNRSAQLGPGMPPGISPPTAATGQAEIKPNEITSSQGDIPHAAAGPVAPSNQWRMAPDGAVYPTPEKNLQMDDFGSPGWLPWMYRNHILPFGKQMVGIDVQPYAPPKSWLPPGATRWVKHPDGSWYPSFDKFDRDVQRSRHNQSFPTPQYDRRR